MHDFDLLLEIVYGYDEFGATIFMPYQGERT